jgi:hypothetical protein
MAAEAGSFTGCSCDQRLRRRHATSWRVIEVRIKAHKLKVESLGRDILKRVVKIQTVPGHHIEDPVQIGRRQMQRIDSSRNNIVKEKTELFAA